MNACTNLKNLNKWQFQQLNEHISKHKWYCSERGLNLNDEDLEKDFINTYFNEVCQKLRLDFCINYCSINDCELRDLFIKRDSLSNSEIS